jgi:hypothetical protein
MTQLILWKRLDAPGHDACRLRATAAGWELEGTAVFAHEGVPARLGYHLACDGAWRTQHGAVDGWIGATPIDFRITRATDGAWTCNGAVVPGLEACADLDLGFTPATNLSQIRRLALSEGQAADCPVAWLDVTSGALEILSQRYERRSNTSYWYEAPRFVFAALLDVSELGFVRRYPGLWEEAAFQSGPP